MSALLYLLIFYSPLKRHSWSVLMHIAPVPGGYLVAVFVTGLFDCKPLNDTRLKSQVSPFFNA